MVEHNWPLKNRIPAEFQFFTISEMIEIFAEIPDVETPLWIDNYWQVRHQITQRPVEVMHLSDDGFHIG